MKENKEIIMRADDWRDFKAAKQCFICGNDFKDGDKKVRDAKASQATKDWC